MEQQTKPKDSRRFMKKTDLLWIGLALLAAVTAMFLLRPQEEAGKQVIAVITVNGEEFERVNLSEDKEEYFIDLSASAGVPVKFQVKDHKIRFTQVQCPDHVCEGYGYIGSETETAVCMPNRTVISIITQDAA